MTDRVRVDDRETAAASLMVSAAADGTTLFPTDGVVLEGSGAMRTLTLTPLEATTGAATITLRVTDRGRAARRHAAFQVSVNARNASMRTPTLNTFAKAEADAADRGQRLDLRAGCGRSGDVRGAICGEE